MLYPENVAQRELQEGESLLWTGKPDPVLEMQQSLPKVFFGLVFTCFSLFWIWMASGPLRVPGQVVPALLLFPLFGLPFLLIGLGFVTSPFWAAQKAKSTDYAITNHRILIITSGKNKSIKSFFPKDIGELEHSERADGSGTIVFATHLAPAANGRQQVVKDQLIGVPNVIEVEQIIRGTFGANLRGVPDEPPGSTSNWRS